MTDDAVKLGDLAGQLFDALNRTPFNRVINLAGKDYFTVREAAAYAGVSYSQWRERIQREFPPAEFCGKLIYRRADVQRFIEQNTQWPRPYDDHLPVRLVTRSGGRPSKGGAA
jgi:hypothetical protein